MDTAKLRGTQIEGGCLCRAIRYTVDFSADDIQEPLMRVTTCQCSQCRKATGSLVSHVVTINPKYIKWQCEASNYREYSSSPGVFRGFCQQCGTTLTWRNESEGTEIDIFSGTIDEAYLLREDGLGVELCYPKDGQNWCENFIAGVTDTIPGNPKYKTSRQDGLTLE